MNDLHSQITADTLNLKGPTRLGASGSVVADLRGYSAAEILIAVAGTGATFSAANLVRISLLHGDTSTAATGACAAADLITSIPPVAGVVKTYNTKTAAAAGLTKIGYIGGKRYLRVRYAASGTATGATGMTGTRISVAVIKGRPNQAPVA